MLRFVCVALGLCFRVESKVITSSGKRELIVLFFFDSLFVSFVLCSLFALPQGAVGRLLPMTGTSWVTSTIFYFYLFLKCHPSLRSTQKISFNLRLPLYRVVYS